ncbi:Myb-like DNA-binding domain containing protein [Tritrichomonas foetus]|uniref:Myb-like DNA-binding domain containing protein n=1 Tax=Tritrichomonas foetus TaxID=1144522 RepID=A0A1J4KM39_9EUKA|nr:Myb-like DNA-binding domain containing protein [Tritrichomonas foetus]|eukprot:OHT12000.1 Myb-like DNA-binding domain containing protein [Tritrichomonas foetus]
MNNSARTKFTPEEDSLLVNYVQIFGMKSWKAIALLMPGRSMRQCRERWKYFLSPDSNNHNQWTAEEDDLLIWQYQEIGPQWSKMAPLFKGRSGVSLKNRYQLLQRNNFLVLSENDNETTPEPTSCSSSEDENGVSLKTKPIVSQSTSKSSTPEFPEPVQQSPIEVVPFNKRSIDFPCSIGQLGLMFN